MAGALATQLAEFFDVVEGNGNFPESFILRIDGFDLREVQQRIEEHGGVAVGEHEAVTIGPDGIIRIVTEEFLPDGVADGSESHWRSRMTGIGGLHGIHGESADGVNAEQVQIRL